MQIIEQKERFASDVPTIVVLGKFDGIHIGHKEILRVMRDKKKELAHVGAKTVAFTFCPSPASFFSGRMIPELMTGQEKRIALAAEGVDILWEFPLNDHTAATEPYLFVEDILHRHLKAAVVVAGEDVSFGKNGLGDASLLMQCAKEFGFELVLLPKICMDGGEVSSSRVRDEIAAGNMEEAMKLLGNPYRISGVVERGAMRGREFGFPTMNLYPVDGKLLPPYGVYFANVVTRKGIFHSITDIGVKPTVTNEGKRIVEACLFDFDEEFYGESITVELLHYRRPEVHFASVEELISTLKEDAASGKRYFQLDA